MYTPSFFLLALLSLGYCVVAVLLIKKIVALKSKVIFLSQIQLCTIEPEISTPDSTSIRKKPIKVERSKSTSTHRKLQIRLPAYSRYRISRLRGARRISKPCYKKMTLYTYLRSKRRKLISRFSKTAN